MESREQYAQKFSQLLTEHLKQYYVHALGLRGVDERIAFRETEEAAEQARLEALLQYIGWRAPLKQLRMLVVGSGWGGMISAALSLGVSVSGLDIDKEAIEIAKLRCLKNGLGEPAIVEAPAESMPYEDGTFDLVYCFTVLEHVQNVEESIREISRVLKKGGYGYIHAPNYCIPWEGHYKVVLPTMLSRWVCHRILMLRGRNTAYFDSLNLITKHSVFKIFEKYGLQQLAEWNVLDVIKCSGELMISKNFKKRRSVNATLRNFMGDPDRYIGALVIQIYRALGVTDITSVVQKKT